MAGSFHGGDDNTTAGRLQVEDIKNIYIRNLYDVMEKNRLYQGGALFQTIEDPMGGRGHNGASYMENGRHIVELSRTANRSTFLHEMSHIWLREIEGVILSGNAYKETQDK